MFTVTRYAVQPYLKGPRGLAPGEPQLHKQLAPAMRAGEAMQKRVAGLHVYAITGEPLLDLWKEPQVVAAFGEVP